MEIKEIKKFFHCACHGEGLLVQNFEDEDDENYKEIYLSMYSYGTYNSKPSLLERLKYAWYHIKTGEKNEDQLILTYDEARDLAEFIKSITK